MRFLNKKRIERRKESLKNGINQFSLTFCIKKREITKEKKIKESRDMILQSQLETVVAQVSAK